MRLRPVTIHRKGPTEKGGSFLISLVVHDGKFTVISRVNTFSSVSSPYSADSADSAVAYTAKASR